MADEKSWAKRVTEWQASGLTAAEYCAGREFTVTALYWWSSRLRKAGLEKGSPRRSIRMARVVRRTSREAAPTESGLELAVVLIERGDARVFVPPGVDRATLAIVLEALAGHQGSSR